MSLLPDWLTGYDSENADRAASADAQLRADNQRKIESGFYTAKQADEIALDYENQSPIGQTAQRADIQAAFGEGLSEGAGNVTGFVRGMFNFVGKALGSVLLGIPVWVWALAALAVFGWLGGFDWLARKSKGVLK